MKTTKKKGGSPYSSQYNNLAVTHCKNSNSFANLSQLFVTGCSYGVLELAFQCRISLQHSYLSLWHCGDVAIYIHITLICSNFYLQGTKLLGVSCDSNDASIIQLSSGVHQGLKTYTCDCKNTVSSGAGTMECYLHYWECPT